MNILGTGCSFVVLFCSSMGVFAGVAPAIIVGPNGYGFSSYVYYADSTATNAIIKVGMSPGNPNFAGTVGYFTQDGTAVADRDYTAVSGEVFINGPPGGSFTVPLRPSNSPVDKTVLLFLKNLTSTDYLIDGGATLVIRAAPLALALPLPLTPMTFKLIACSQGEKLGVLSTRTNHTRIATNITQVTQSTLNSTTFGTEDILALLQNSFETNFPNGAQIAISMGRLYVVDHTGSNTILDPASVVSLNFGEQFVSGLETQMNNQNNTVPSSSGNNTEAITARATLIYDDSGMTTTDGTSTKFDFSGLYIMKVSTNLKTLFSKVSVNLQGTGDGTVRNQQTILTGTITGNTAGTPSSP